MNLPHAHRGSYLPPIDPPRERLSTWLIGGAAIVVWFFFLFVLLPVLAA